ncbi:MAG: sensor histidine kinase [Helicobacteraceae bacterium]|nr:sensor histidine kinase [Helicobacteraceae bacterium]
MNYLKHRAVLLTVLFALSVSLFSISYTFYKFYESNNSSYVDSIFTRYSVITQILREHTQKSSPVAVLEANLALYKLSLIDNSDEVQIIIKLSKVLKREGFQAIEEALFQDKMGVYEQQIIHDMRASMLEYNKEIYFYIESSQSATLIKDETITPYMPLKLLYTFLIIIFVITSSFLLILSRIRPLRDLRQRIALFGEGKMDISFALKGSDEIALVSNELENTRSKINVLLESRTLFMRNIMHELKTPITKGRIASEMLPTDKQRERFSGIFLRLEELIAEFALIEELTSAQERIELKEYKVIDLIDAAVDMAMVSKHEVAVEIDENGKLLVDFKFFTTAIKNMIDNGIKYSSDSKVSVKMINKSLYFESKGVELKHKLSYYIEPFTKDVGATNSFGLGLYLVDTILKIHKFNLEYKYQDESNIFIFNFKTLKL